MSSLDDREEFRHQQRREATRMAADETLRAASLDLYAAADRHGYSYQWSWLGVPIIQIPPDIVALQEIIWETRPDVVVETGVARGGSLVFSASILELSGNGRVIGVDIDVRDHNRDSIDSSPVAHRIEIVEGGSTDEATVDAVRGRIPDGSEVMVVLDSDHAEEHVYAELQAYAPLVTPGHFLVVSDTIIEHIPEQRHRPRRWGPGDNPATALERFLAQTDEFEADPYFNGKLLMSSSPGGYLRRR